MPLGKATELSTGMDLLTTKNIKRKFLASLPIFLFLFWGTSVYSQDFDFGQGAQQEQSLSSWSLPLRGQISAGTAYTPPAARWNELGPWFNLILDSSTSLGLFYGEADVSYNGAYRLEDDPDYVVDHYEFKPVLRELYWQKSYGPLSLTLGKKIVVWGKADILPVADMVSAQDMTELFFAKPEEARIGQHMLQLQYFGPSHQLDLLLIPYPVPHRITDGDHPYSLTPGYRLTDNKTPWEQDYWSKNTHDFVDGLEGGLRYRYHFAGGSVALMGGRFHNRLPMLNTSFGKGTELRFDPEYEPYYTLASSTNLAWDPLLIKLEAAYSWQKPRQKLEKIQLTPLSPTRTLPAGALTKDETSFLVGFDYNLGEPWGMLMTELSVKAPIHKDARLKTNREVVTAALAYNNTFLREKLTTDFFVYFLESIANIVTRAQLSYKIFGNLTLTTQYTFITIGEYEKNYGLYEDMDRGDIQLDYSFDLAGN